MQKRGKLKELQALRAELPAPGALSEALVRAGAEPSEQIIEHLQRYSVAFDEDRRRSKTDFSPLNLAVVHHAVLNIPKRDGAKMSLDRNRVKAAGNSAFRAGLLAS